MQSIVVETARAELTRRYGGAWALVGDAAGPQPRTRRLTFQRRGGAAQVAAVVTTGERPEVLHTEKLSA